MRNPSSTLLLGKTLVSRKTLALAAAFAAVLILAAPSLRADIVLDTAFPTIHQSARIHVTDEGGVSIPDAQVTATYRPGSAVERSSIVGTTASDGTFEWTPSEAGIVTIAATWTGADDTEHTTSVNASVKFDPTPIAGIIIMIVAGIVLIGGGIERIFSLLRTPEAG